jgi:hypothetical protein
VGVVPELAYSLQIIERFEQECRAQYEHNRKCRLENQQKVDHAVPVAHQSDWLAPASKRLREIGFRGGERGNESGSRQPSAG